MLSVVLTMLLAAADAPVPATARLAVLEFDGDGVPVGYRQAVTDNARAGALDASGQSLEIVTRENMAVILRSMGACDAEEGECGVDTGRTLGARFVLVGTVFHLPNSWQLSMKLLETEKGALLGAESASAATQEALLEVTRHVAETVVRTGTARALHGQGTGSEALSIQVPVVDTTRLSTGTLQNINIDAEEFLERARTLQSEHTANGRDVAAAWCDLAALQDNNPYQAAAESACASWKTYVRERARLQAQHARDFDTLMRFLRLGSRTRTEKLAACAEFLTAYSNMPESTRLAQAKDACQGLSNEEKLQRDAELRRLQARQHALAAQAKAAENQRVRTAAVMPVTVAALGSLVGAPIAVAFLMGLASWFGAAAVVTWGGAGNGTMGFAGMAMVVAGVVVGVVGTAAWVALSSAGLAGVGALSWVLADKLGGRRTPLPKMVLAAVAPVLVATGPFLALGLLGSALGAVSAVLGLILFGYAEFWLNQGYVFYQLKNVGRSGQLLATGPALLLVIPGLLLGGVATLVGHALVAPSVAAVFAKDGAFKEAGQAANAPGAPGAQK